MVACKISSFFYSFACLLSKEKHTSLISIKRCFQQQKNNLSYVIYHIEARLYTGQECVFSSKHEILERLLQDSEKALDHVFKYSF